MAARYVSSKLISSVTFGKRIIDIAYVDKTTAWVRVSGYPATQIREDFVEVVKNNIEKFDVDIVKIAMKESLHKSQADHITHYSAYGIDANENVVDFLHLHK